MLVLLHVKNFTSITQRTLLHGDHMTIAKALGRKLTFYALPFYLASYWHEKKLRKAAWHFDKDLHESGQKE